MASIGKRLLMSTADVAATVAAKTAAAEAEGGTRTSSPRTAPGQILAARGEMLAMQSELTELRRRLQQFDGSMPTVRLDPSKVMPSRWANRHERSFEGASFARLKASIELAGGNTQPILVRPTADPARHEVVFGHRRHRACLQLGIPVLAVVWSGPMEDLDLFLSMDRENREREDPSAYEQGLTYRQALEAGLFPSQRRLAEATGVSHTWVRKALQVAELPEAIVETFRSPLEIQPGHAQEIAQALEKDRKAVMRRAERLRQSAKALSPSQVLAHLLGLDQSARSQTRPLKVGDQAAGAWRRDPKGRAVITLDAPYADDETMSRVEEALRDVLSSRKQAQA